MSQIYPSRARGTRDIWVSKIIITLHFRHVREIRKVVPVSCINASCKCIVKKFNDIKKKQKKNAHVPLESVRVHRMYGDENERGRRVKIAVNLHSRAIFFPTLRRLFASRRRYPHFRTLLLSRANRSRERTGGQLSRWSFSAFAG